METPSDRYIRSHSTPQSEALAWVERQTNIRTNYPRMLSGPVQGRFLTMLVELTGAKRILEIGTFTGYSSICMAYGLPSDGHIDTLEINDEMADLIAEGFLRAGVADKISLLTGDAKKTLKSLIDGGVPAYDLVYIDADKREYCEYYSLAMELVRPGGCILADDVLWDGKLFAETLPSDKQTAGIAAFNETVAKDPRAEVVILPVRDGLSIIRKRP